MRNRFCEAHENSLYSIRLLHAERLGLDAPSWRESRRCPGQKRLNSFVESGCDCCSKKRRCSGLLLAADEPLDPLVKNSVFVNCTREVAERVGSDSLS